MNLTGIKEDIEKILFPYLKVNSETGTNGEKEAEAFLLTQFQSMAYFQKNPEAFGAFPVPMDPHGRAVCWGLVRGKGDKTAVLLHHYDVVNVEDFKTLKSFAFDPVVLEQELLKIHDELHEEAAKDLSSKAFLFGRGAADMKAGGAVQLALLDRFGREENPDGNLLLIALPDEENLSAGMRAAILLLRDLRKQYGLQYVYAFNSEPHQRKEPEVGLLSEGSVGKLLAFVYVRGFLAHVGKVFEGLNPLGALTAIAEKTELSSTFSDCTLGEASPPPTWLYLRDRKEAYDVSMPLGAGGCVSILTLDSTPEKVLAKLLQVSEEGFSEFIERMNQSYAKFLEDTGRSPARLPWKPAVCTFGELLAEAISDSGKGFRACYNEKRDAVNRDILSDKLSLMEASFALTEFVYNFVGDLSPRVVVGLVPPYYPNVSNALLSVEENPSPELAVTLDEFAKQQFGQHYDREYYFTGISDLSYFALKDSGRIEEALLGSMPLYGEAYSIPLGEIEELSMPCMNIGPWGKDFHKLTERVYKPDLYERTPTLLDKAVGEVLGE